ncbi:hypothetical protein BDN70DRAFT_932626 [Pholiota conissans]|uniref:Uncharacterized protein n=1 Tax=Pholiota conissans TaxID=109636 RepID=A0A9P5Z0W8_9AGAR|nr:hypothetical protein BDN70DRAFT_932626 [Pholiota conissans]
MARPSVKVLVICALFILRAGAAVVVPPAPVTDTSVTTTPTTLAPSSSSTVFPTTSTTPTTTYPAPSCWTTTIVSSVPSPTVTGLGTVPKALLAVWRVRMDRRYNLCRRLVLYSDLGHLLLAVFTSTPSDPNADRLLLTGSKCRWKPMGDALAMYEL